MHFILACNVSIGGTFVSPFVDRITVESGWKNLIDVSEITLPKKLLEYQLIDPRPGDEVKINLGYQGYTRDVFSGFVSEVNPKVPLQIKCEDAGWLLKRSYINKSWTSEVTFKEILGHVIGEVNNQNDDYPNIEFVANEIPEITFDEFLIKNSNAAQVLQKFKETPYGFAIYFEGKQLKIHLPYISTGLGDVEYFLDQNVARHNLEYQSADQKKVQIKTVLLKPDNTYEEQTYGIPGGDLFVMNFNKGESSDLIKQLAQIRQSKYLESYKGSLTTFMVPFARHGMIARVVDPEYSRDSRHYIDGTKIQFDDGVLITVDLGIKV